MHAVVGQPGHSAGLEYNSKDPVSARISRFKSGPRRFSRFRPAIEKELFAGFSGKKRVFFELVCLVIFFSKFWPYHVFALFLPELRFSAPFR